jgi:hypothetical protein
MRAQQNRGQGCASPDCRGNDRLNKDQWMSPSPSAQLPPIRVPTFRFSTQTVPERERVAAWYDVLGRQAVRLDAQPLSEHHRVDGVVLGLPALPIVQFRCRRQATKSFALTW